MSTLFLRTLRDDPADAEVPSHRLLVRAGYIRRIAAGIYSWLPLGLITYRNIENIVRDETKKQLCLKNNCHLIYVNPGYILDDIISQIEKIIQ
jgi:prolyl-tRNA synthetase